jgi:PTS system N-acetylglucosamine-specific IIA component
MTTVSSPVTGVAVGLGALPDPVFAEAMVGPGTAVDPAREPGVAVAPLDGVVVSLHPHAFVVVDGQGRGVLTHLGLDTVQLAGEGFETLVDKGDAVARGQAVVRWNPAAVERAGKSPVCPVIALDAGRDGSAGLDGVREDGKVSAGDTLFRWV